MKKIYISFLFLLSITDVLTAQYYKQYFDGADTSKNNSVQIIIDPDTNNIWQIGKPKKVFFKSAATQPKVIITDTINNYPAKNQSRFKMKVDLNMAFGVVAIQWMQKLDMDSTDIGMVEFTTNKGATWQNAFNNPYVYNFYGFNSVNQVTLSTAQVGFSKRDTSWKNVWLCFSTSWINQFPDSVLFRFTFKSDSLGTGKEGWMMDNFGAAITIIHTALTEKKNEGRYITVYPNPADDVLHIEVEALKQYHLIEAMELIGPEGRVLQSWKKIPTKFWIDTKPYKEGNYLLKVQTNIKSETIPFIIKRQ